jgi:hypothetical protein
MDTIEIIKKRCSCGQEIKVIREEVDNKTYLFFYIQNSMSNISICNCGKILTDKELLYIGEK